ncbi:hypothetical protein [Pseudomonas azerbaijanorientalis]|nr:hypothetical protein [Pseudomonas azerbaijanorientalis]
MSDFQTETTPTARKTQNAKRKTQNYGKPVHLEIAMGQGAT